jgi:hypothetical protein
VVTDDDLPVEWVPLDSLHPHPRNYRTHPPEQIAHLAASIEQHGFFRPVVIARDSTILAGHGVVEASRSIDVERVPAVRLDLDPMSAQALKILTVDNELPRFAQVNDRALTDLLRDIAQSDPEGLVGTGYDETMLTALLMATRPVSEIADFDAAAAWLGLPDFEGGGEQFKLIVTCFTRDDLDQFVDRFGLRDLISNSNPRSLSLVWPPREELTASVARKWQPVEP